MILKKRIKRSDSPLASFISNFPTILILYPIYAMLFCAIVLDFVRENVNRREHNFVGFKLKVIVGGLPTQLQPVDVG